MFKSTTLSYFKKIINSLLQVPRRSTGNQSEWAADNILFDSEDNKSDAISMLRGATSGVYATEPGVRTSEITRQIMLIYRESG